MITGLQASDQGVCWTGEAGDRPWSKRV